MKKFRIGDLVWIPAFTDLMIMKESFDNNDFISRGTFKTTHREEPYYGLVLETNSNVTRILLEKEKFYVRTKEIYGAEDDNFIRRSY